MRNDARKAGNRRSGDFNIVVAVNAGNAGGKAVESRKTSVRIVQRRGRTVVRDERRRSNG